MSYQAYLDTIEKQTGKTPAEIIELAKQSGFPSDSKVSETAAWLKTTLALGHGHAMALAGVIKNGPIIKDKHVGTNNTHSDPSNTLRLDGIANRNK